MLDTVLSKVAPASGLTGDDVLAMAASAGGGGSSSITDLCTQLQGTATMASLGLASGQSTMMNAATTVLGVMGMDVKNVLATVCATLSGLSSAEPADPTAIRGCDKEEGEDGRTTSSPVRPLAGATFDST
eukprot:gene43255-39428_t